jgi:hypothetical protein
VSRQTEPAHRAVYCDNFITRRSSICFILLSLGCLSYASFIYLFPMFVILLCVPFYLLLVSHCVARPLSVCLTRTSVLLYTAGAEGRNRYHTRWRAGRIKRIDVVASSGRYFSTQSIILIPPPNSLYASTKPLPHGHQSPPLVATRPNFLPSLLPLRFSILLSFSIAFSL